MERPRHALFAETMTERNTLVDSFGRTHDYLRISLTERCNLRCEYCMPEEGVELSHDDDLLTTPEIIRAARIFVERGGVRKIRLTGGEPLLRRDIAELCAALKSLSGLEKLGITTNGILLKKKLPSLLAAGVDLVNISLDTLDKDKFIQMTKRNGLEKVLGAVESAVDLGVEPLKVNCVVMRGINDDEVTRFVAWTKYMPIEVRFIEFMPFNDNKWSSDTLVPFRDMVRDIRKTFPDFQVAASGNASEVAKMWHVPGHAGRVGFITSMTQQFCGSCNRLRMMADGNLKVCLFGSEEFGLRDVLRSSAHDDDDVVDAIQRALNKKHAALGGNTSVEELLQSSGTNRSMVRIGG